MHYQVYDFSSWKELDIESGGANEKVWLQDPNTGARGLFKFAKVNHGVPCGEYWSEKLASDLIRLMGLHCMSVDMGAYQGRLGSMCYDISQTHGIKFTEMVRIIQPVEKKNGKISYAYRFDDIKQEMQSHCFENFILMLIIDYLIGNNDRHLGNIALENRSLDLAPLYDNGSSLACRESLENIIKMGKDKMQYDSFVFNKPTSKAIIDDSGKETKHLALMQFLSERETESYSQHVNMLQQNVYDRSLKGVLDRFDQVIPIETRDLILKVIMDRLLKL